MIAIVVSVHCTCTVARMDECKGIEPASEPPIPAPCNSPRSLLECGKRLISDAGCTGKAKTTTRSEFRSQLWGAGQVNIFDCLTPQYKAEVEGRNGPICVNGGKKRTDAKERMMRVDGGMKGLERSELEY